MKIFGHTKDEIVNMFIDYIKSNGNNTNELIQLNIIKNSSSSSIGIIYFEQLTKDIIDDILESVDVDIIYLPEMTDTQLEKTNYKNYRIEYFPVVVSYPRNTFGVWQYNKKIQHFRKNQKLHHFSTLSYKVFNNSNSSILYLKIIFKR